MVDAVKVAAWVSATDDGFNGVERLCCDGAAEGSR